MIYVNPSVIAASSPADPVEQAEGWHRQLIVPDTNLPGPGNVVHILFNTGSKVITNAQGQVSIRAIKIHADISGQQDVIALGYHFWADVLKANISPGHGNGCPVKFY